MHLNQRTTTHRAMAKAEGNLAEGLLGAIPRVGPRGMRVSETPVLRGFSLALMPSPPASRLPPPLPLTRTEGLATATTPEHSAGLAELMLGLPRNTGKVFFYFDPVRRNDGSEEGSEAGEEEEDEL